MIESGQLAVDSLILAASIVELYILTRMDNSLDDIEDDIESIEEDQGPRDDP